MLVVQVAAGILLISAITISGMLADSLVWPRAVTGRTAGSSAWLLTLLIDAFYSVPTYIAVIGIGHARAYFQRFSERERILARAQLQALKGQLNPHFLFNTLNAVSMLGYRDPAMADLALTRTSELLRFSFADKDKHETSLRDELAFIGSYTELYRLLLKDRLRVSFRIAPDAWHAAVPTMMLQPLVENAIVHGVAKRISGGRIQISAKRSVTDLILVIMNDGAPPDQECQLMGTGLGMKNTRERLQVLYGDAQHLIMTHEQTGATSVELRLPYRELSEDMDAIKS
jgi:sensor histidine kinase YesM